MTNSKAELRKFFLHQRRNLSEANRLEQELAITQHITQLTTYKHASSIAVYLSMPGECNLQHVMDDAYCQQKTIVAPIIQNKQKRSMLFYPLKKEAPQYITDQNTTAFSMATCDLILVPLVAFDRAGNRLGMGAGFYDQLIRDLQDVSSHQPYVLGVAYREQEAECIPCDPWDRPLDGIVTPDGIIGLHGLPHRALHDSQ